VTPDPTRAHDPAPPTGTFDPALEAGLAAAFGPDADLTPGGWSRPPHLRDDPSAHAPLVHPSSPEMPRGGATPYQLLGEIARGGMGVVLKGRDPNLGRDLAVKVLKAELATKPAAVQRFVEEAQVGGQLQHPGVVPVYDLGRLADGRPYFAMKLVKGRTMADLLADRPDPAADRGRFVRHFLQVCQTVAYAHSKGVVHRDLKPSNVMVGAFDEVLVMDWGLAKVLPRGGVADERRASRAADAPPADDPTEIKTARFGSGSDTAAGSVMGTPAFMAPEQAGGETDKLDERADVFGLGAILCVVLTGKPPYLAATGEAVRLMAVRGDLAECRGRLAACGADPELVALCGHCLAADRADRPRDAAAVSAAVAAHLAGVERRAHAAELARVAAEVEAREQRKRRRVQLSLGAAAAALLFATGGFAWRLDRQGEQRRRDEATAAEVRRTEERLKAEAAAAQVARLLELAADLRRQYRFAQARTALTQAGESAANGSPDLAAAVARAAADLDLVAALDAVRGKRSEWVIEEGEARGKFDTAGVPPAYRAALAARGWDVVADPDGVADRVAASAVRTELVSALDDWLTLEPDEAVRDRVLVALRRADPDSGAAPFRDPGVWTDKAKLEKLAASLDPARLSPGAVVAVAHILIMRKLDAVRLDPNFPGAHLNLGRALTATRDFDGAAAVLREAVRRAPRNAVRHACLADVLNSKGDRVGATTHYREALRLDPVKTLANAAGDITLADPKEVAAAAAAVRDVLEKNPADAAAHFSLGYLTARQNNPAAAVAHYREAVRLDPTHARAHRNLARSLAQKGDLDGALAAAKEAIRVAPTDPVGYDTLGNVLSRRGDGAAAVAAYTESIRLEPNWAGTHLNLGTALGRAGDPAGAAAAFAEAARLDPKAPGVYSRLGFALRAAGDPFGADAALKEAAKYGAKGASAHAARARELADKGDLDAAVDAMREAIRLNPKSAAYRNNLGVMLSKTGDFAAAAAAYREALELGPPRADTFNNLGAALERLKDSDGALAAYRDGLKLNPTPAGLHVNAGNLLLNRKDYTGAVAAYREAVRLEPNRSSWHVNLGNGLARSGDYAGAEAALGEALRVNPKDADAHNGLAWQLATGPDGVRDGKRAVEHASRAYERSDWKEPEYLDTLAAAHAEAGDFAKAVESQKRALAFPTARLLNEAEWQARLAGYEREQPYRVPAPAPPPVAPPPREAKR
jgi:tetratricopeptide (TPR) repeat protein/serine/threonine protein kinase